MTENKQYNYNYSIYSDRWIIKYKHKIIVSVSSEIEAKVIVDTLNRNCNVYKYQKELIKTLRKDINDFEKENEQLKEENKKLKQSNKDAWNLIRFIYNEIKEDGYMDWGRIQDLVEF